MAMTKVYGYNTHYEIQDYDKGEYERIEKDLSLWDDINFKVIPKYHIDEDKRIMYVPRGYDEVKIMDLSGQYITYIKEHTPIRNISFDMKYTPRNDLQKECIRFLCGKDEYKYTENATQLVLSIPPGEGKTYCMVASLSILKAKAIIIVNTNELVDQWKQRISEYSDIPDKGVVVISSNTSIEKLMKAKTRQLNNNVIYIATHATLRNYIKNKGYEGLNNLFYNLGIGVKVFDEAHLEYSSILQIDYATNVWKTIYLSATFARSDVYENKLFQKCFNKVYKLVKVNEEKRKHVIYIPYIYKTKPTHIDLLKMRPKNKFNVYKYIEYELEEGTITTIISLFIDLMMSKNIKGKYFILSSKTESCDIFKKLIDDFYPEFKACVHYNGNKVDNMDEYDIICATPKMLGTGKDLPGLRVIINTEPTWSIPNTIQIIGRLREYSKTEDTYYIEIIDKGVSNVYEMYRTKKKSVLNEVKAIYEMDKTIKK